MESEIERSERLKAKKKAVPGGPPKLINLVKNWAHQGFLYMDSGEQFFKLLTEACEFLIVFSVLYLLNRHHMSVSIISVVSLAIVHTFNWVTNNLFWSIIIFTFPKLKNRGKEQTFYYLVDMADRLRSNKSVTGLALYGSITRRQWHDRSDIDMRILRAPGFLNLIRAGAAMTKERFIAFLKRQPTDIFLADDVDFLAKMRSDERPVLLIKRDPRLDIIYPDNSEQGMSPDHLLNTALPADKTG